MRIALSLAAAALLAGPAIAQPPHEPLDESDFSAAVPSQGEVREMGFALDRMIGALMSVDIGPIIDATDPDRRNPEYGRPGRTVGEMGRRDDPYFEQRMRAGVHGATTGIGEMMSAFATVAPQLQRSIEEMSRSIDGAMHAIPPAPEPEFRGGDERWEDEPNDE